MDASEYSRIARAYIDDVYRAALSCCRNRADAEDAVQNTFLRLMTSDVVFRDDEHIRRWLVRVTLNECKNHLKSFWRRNVSLSEVIEAPDASINTEEGELSDALSRLPSKYSAVLHLYYYEGYSCAEIAEVLRISESNVQTRLMRARKILKKNLEEA